VSIAGKRPYVADKPPICYNLFGWYLLPEPGFSGRNQFFRQQYEEYK